MITGPSPLVERFRTAASARPHAVALVEHSSRRTTTYAELASGVDSVASEVRRAGWAGRFVLVALPASTALVTAELGVRAAGAVPVVVGGDVPPARLAELVETSACAGVVGQGDLGQPDVPRLTLDAGPAGLSAPIARPGPALPTDACYGVFTSGSTGTPKLVTVPESALVNLLDWYTAAYGIGAGAVTAHMVNPAFDVHVMETWAAMTFGATALLVDTAETRLEPTALVDMLVTHRVNTTFVPTPLARGLVDALAPGRTPALRHVLIGGDRLDFWPPAGLGPVFHNQYGPAECAVVSTAVDLRAVPARQDAAPPIGTMIPGATSAVLDEDGRPTDVGEVGELWIGGAGVALGYAWRSDLTDERFVVRDGDRMYRTGDLVRADDDGMLWFVGRADRQVKVRGFRIEPGEVEAAALRCDGVREAVVVADDSTGTARLVAFVVGEAEPASVRASLAERLPPYMVPSVVRVLARLPLTANDKVDRAALLGLATVTAAAEDDELDALDGLERELADIWQVVLQVGAVGAADDFYELGGHSLAAMRVVALAAERGLDVRLRDMLTGQSLREVARLCART